MIRRILPLLFAALAGAALAAPEIPRIVPGEVVTGAKAMPVAKVRLDAATTPTPLVLPAVTEAELEAVRKANRSDAAKGFAKRVRIGTNRDVPTPPPRPPRPWRPPGSPWMAVLQPGSPSRPPKPSPCAPASTFPACPSKLK